MKNVGIAGRKATRNCQNIGHSCLKLGQRVPVVAWLLFCYPINYVLWYNFCVLLGRIEQIQIASQIVKASSPACSTWCCCLQLFPNYVNPCINSLKCLVGRDCNFQSTLIIILNLPPEIHQLHPCLIIWGAGAFMDPELKEIRKDEFCYYAMLQQRWPDKNCLTASSINLYAHVRFIIHSLQAYVLNLRVKGMQLNFKMSLKRHFFNYRTRPSLLPIVMPRFGRVHQRSPYLSR